MSYYGNRKTGNTRTIVFQGTFSCPVGYQGIVNSTDFSQSFYLTRGAKFSSVTATWGDFIGSQFAKIEVVVSYTTEVLDASCASGFAMTAQGHYVITMDLGGGTFYSFTSTPVEIGRACWPLSSLDGTTASISSVISGTYNIQLDVEEWSGTKDFTSAPGPRPSVGSDGPPAIEDDYWETTVVGSNVLRMSVDVGLLGSTSHSLSNASSGSPIAYQTGLRAFASSLGTGSQSDCVAIITGVFAGISLGETSSDTGSGSIVIPATGSEFDVKAGTYSYEWDVHTSSGAYAHSTGQIPTGHNVILYSQPPWQINYTGSVLLFDGSSYPNPLVVRFYSCGRFETLSFIGSFSHNVIRRIFTAFRDGLTTGAIIIGHGDDYSDPVGWCQLDNGSLGIQGEDFGDIRLMGKGRSWNAISLHHLSSLLVDDCSDGSLWAAGAHTTKTTTVSTVKFAASGGVGTGTATYSPKKVVEAYRYLDITLRSLVSDSVTVRVTIGTKYWDIKTSVHNTYITQTIDLCCPDGLTTGSLTTQDSRWPITSYTNVSTLDNTPQHESSNWGVNYINTLVIGNIPDGETIQLDNLTLNRKYYAKGHVASTFSSIANQGFQQYITPVGLHTIAAKRHVLGNTDGRQSLEAMDSFYTEGGYTPVNIDYLATELGRIPGWVSTNLNPLDTYYNNTIQYAYIVGTADANWLEWDATFSRTLIACFQFDVLGTYPGQQSADGGGDNSGNPLVVNCAPKILRGSGHGIALDSHLKPAIGKTIQIRESVSLVNAGLGKSDSPGGYFITGEPFAKGSKNIDFVSSGSIIGTGLAINRHKRRVDGKVISAPVGQAHITKSIGQSFNYSVEYDTVGGTMTVRRFCPFTGQDDELPAYSTPDFTALGKAQITWRHDAQLSILFERMDLDHVTHAVLNHNVFKITNLGTGAVNQWSDPVTVAPGKNPAAAVHDQSGIEFCAVYDTDRWKMYRLMPGNMTYDLVGDVAITSTNDQSAGLEFSPVATNDLIFKYTDGSLIKRITSTDFGSHWN